MKRLTQTLTAGVLLAMVIALAPVQARAGDRSFSSVVKHIQKEYNGQRQGTFGLVSFGRLLVKMIKPAGVKNFKVVLFKSADFSHLNGSEEIEFNRFVQASVSEEWRPLVQFASRKNRQWTYVYCTEEKEDVKFLVVNLQQKNAFVAQFKFSPDKLVAFMNDPKIMGVPLNNKTEARDKADEATAPPSNQSAEPPKESR